MYQNYKSYICTYEYIFHPKLFSVFLRIWWMYLWTIPRVLQWLLYTGTCSCTQTGLCSLWRCFSIICFNNHENTYFENVRNGHFRQFCIVYSIWLFWGVEWDTKILIQIMYFTLKPLTYFFFQSTVFRIN